MDRVRAHQVKAVAKLAADVRDRFGCTLDAWKGFSEPERALFWREHPEHAWYGFLREDWMGAVGRPDGAPLH